MEDLKEFKGVRTIDCEHKSWDILKDDIVEEVTEPLKFNHLIKHSCSKISVEQTGKRAQRRYVVFRLISRESSREEASTDSVSISGTSPIDLPVFLREEPPVDKERSDEGEVLDHGIGETDWGEHGEPPFG